MAWPCCGTLFVGVGINVELSISQIVGAISAIVVFTTCVVILLAYVAKEKEAPADEGFVDAVHQSRIDTMAILGGRIGVLEGQILQFKMAVDGLLTLETRMHQLELQLPSMLELQEKYSHSMDKLHKRVATRDVREAEKVAATNTQQNDFLTQITEPHASAEPEPPHSPAGVMGNGGRGVVSSMSQFDRRKGKD